jgi:hypothetical protein
MTCTYTDREQIHLCPDCLKADGSFCLGCGEFCAGMTSFDFIHPGFCDSCWDEIQSAESWDDDDANDGHPEYEDSEYNYEQDCDEDHPNGSLDY